MSKGVKMVSLDAVSSVDEASTDEDIQASRSDPADLMLRQEDDALIQQALDSLPSTCRTAVELSDIDGLTYQRISEILACPLQTVRSRIEEGHLRMKKTLKEIERRGRALTA